MKLFIFPFSTILGGVIGLLIYNSSLELQDTLFEIAKLLNDIPDIDIPKIGLITFKGLDHHIPAFWAGGAGSLTVDLLVSGLYKLLRKL